MAEIALDDREVMKRGGRLSALLDAFSFPMRTEHFTELLNPLWRCDVVRVRISAIAESVEGIRLVCEASQRNIQRFPSADILLIAEINGRQLSREAVLLRAKTPGSSRKGSIQIALKLHESDDRQQWLSQLQPRSIVRLSQSEYGLALADDVKNEPGLGRLTFARSDVVAHSTKELPLLELAENAGLSPRYGCRRGLCHSCDRPLLAGQVRNQKTGEVIAERGALVQLCICVAAGDAVIDL